MNLKNLALGALLVTLLPAMCGCEEWKTDEQLVKDIWQEAQKIAGCDWCTLMPKVMFFKKKPSFFPDSMGICDTGTRRIGIFLDRHTDYIWRAREAYQKSRSMDGCDVSHEGEIAVIYGTVGHEMLHAMYDETCGSHCDQHRMMKESGNLMALTNFISQRLKLPEESRVCVGELHMRALLRGIEEDKKNKK